MGFLEEATYKKEKNIFQCDVILIALLEVALACLLLHLIQLNILTSVPVAELQKFELCQKSHLHFFHFFHLPYPSAECTSNQP